MESFKEKIGKYLIESELGKGATGIVYRAVDKDIERTIALKTVRKDLLNHQDAEEILTRFKREAQTAGSLMHPNIVAVYEYGEDGNTVYIAMEYVEGRELKEIFDHKERFDLSDIVKIMSQILGALSYAHRNGVIHRDIKPANIIVNNAGYIKITDFGVAHIESSNLTQAGTVIGTPSYMSPEQCMGQRVDQRSDLFSAGILLYQLVTGETPFTGQSITTIMYKIVHDQPVEPSKLNIRIPSIFDSIIRKALAKRPEDRFQSADEFHKSVRQALQSDLKVKNKDFEKNTADDDTDTVILTPPILTSAPEPSLQNSSRSVSAKAVLGIVTALIIAGAGWWYYSKDPKISGQTDNSAPAIPEKTVPSALISGISNQYLVGDTVHYSVSASDNRTLKKVTFRVAGTSVVQSEDIIGKSAVHAASFSTRDLAPGMYSFIFSAEDNNGNIFENTGSFGIAQPLPADPVQTGSDNEQPSAKISGIKDTYMKGDAVSFAIEAADNEALRDVAFEVSNISQKWDVSGKSAVRNYSFSTRTWTPGAYRYSYTVSDQSDNIRKYDGTFTLTDIQYGYVNINTIPWTKVYIDGKYIQSTPIAKMKLPAGNVSVRFVNESKNIDEEKSISVAADKTSIHSFEWK